VGSLALLKNRTWRDATYEFDLTMLPGSALAEAQFRKEQPFNIWRKQPTAGNLLRFTTAGQVTLVVGDKVVASAKTGKDFTLRRRVKITTRGSAIGVYLDGDPVPIIDAQSSYCSHGYFLFSAMRAHVHFYNVRIAATKAQERRE
jgi:hypothetical protein